MTIEPAILRTADGLALEAEVSLPEGPDQDHGLWAAAVLAHPDPRQGGTMRSIVPGTLFAELPAAGVAALRFNFRGVEGSDGAYGHGLAEQVDVVAAIDALADAVGSAVPIALCGWSFGADVVLAVGDERARGWFAAAPPLRVVDPETMAAAHDARPKLLAVPERDAFRSPAAAASATASWSSTRIEVVAGADHFFVGRTHRLTPLCLELLRSLRPDG